jgi:hypothetical protein
LLLQQIFQNLLACLPENGFKKNSAFLLFWKQLIQGTLTGVVQAAFNPYLCKKI